jgi:hypothetical protein
MKNTSMIKKQKHRIHIFDREHHETESRERCGTLPLAEEPRGSGLTVTVPFMASSSTVGETVVFIGTPSLLFEKAETSVAFQLKTVNYKTDIKCCK